MEGWAAAGRNRIILCITIITEAVEGTPLVFSSSIPEKLTRAAVTASYRNLGTA